MAEQPANSTTLMLRTHAVCLVTSNLLRTHRGAKSVHVHAAPVQH